MQELTESAGFSVIVVDAQVFIICFGNNVIILDDAISSSAFSNKSICLSIFDYPFSGLSLM